MYIYLYRERERERERETYTYTYIFIYMYIYMPCRPLKAVESSIKVRMVVLQVAQQHRDRGLSSFSADQHHYVSPAENLRYHPFWVTESQTSHVHTNTQQHAQTYDLNRIQTWTRPLSGHISGGRVEPFWRQWALFSAYNARSWLGSSKHNLDPTSCRALDSFDAKSVTPSAILLSLILRVLVHMELSHRLSLCMVTA